MTVNESGDENTISMDRATHAPFLNKQATKYKTPSKARNLHLITNIKRQKAKFHRAKSVPPTIKKQTQRQRKTKKASSSHPCHSLKRTRGPQQITKKILTPGSHASTRAHVSVKKETSCQLRGSSKRKSDTGPARSKQEQHQ